MLFTLKASGFVEKLENAERTCVKSFENNELWEIFHASLCGHSFRAFPSRVHAFGSLHLALFLRRKNSFAAALVK
jgi:hypothetical protein